MAAAHRLSASPPCSPQEERGKRYPQRFVADAAPQGYISPLYDNRMTASDVSASPAGGEEGDHWTHAPCAHGRVAHGVHGSTWLASRLTAHACMAAVQQVLGRQEALQGCQVPGVRNGALPQPLVPLRTVHLTTMTSHLPSPSAHHT